MVTGFIGVEGLVLVEEVWFGEEAGVDVAVFQVEICDVFVMDVL